MMSLENLTFKGGFHMADKKELSKDCPLEKGPEPKLVSIVLHQHIGAPCEPLVKVKDEVKLGQKIGESKATITAPVHSSVSGVVKKIDDVITPDGVKAKAIIIESDGKDEIGYEEKNDNFEDLSVEEIVKRVREAGIVGLGGAAFPTAVKITRNPDDNIDSIIINGAECEPYLTADQVNMENYPDKVVKGLQIVMKTMDAQKGYIAIEDNKPKAIEAIKKAAAKVNNVEVAVLKTKYPQGDLRRIIDAVTGKRIPSSVRCTNMGTQGVNCTTAITIADAVEHGKPLYERTVTVTGSAINTPKNMTVKIGTSVKELLEYCGGFKETPGKIILGGPMMGASQYGIDAVIEKATNGVIVLNKEEAKPPVVSPCIKCGKCVEVCPINLMPLYLEARVSKERFEEANELNIMECIECGTCSYICPAKRPLVETFRHGKRQIKALERKRR